jgi:hypothetical protein
MACHESLLHLKKVIGTLQNSIGTILDDHSLAPRVIANENLYSGFVLVMENLESHGI